MRNALILPAAWERLLSGGVFLLPLLCWPGLAHPFSTPKLWLLGCLAFATLATPKALRAPEWPWLLWLAALALSASFAPSVSLEALLLMLLALPLFRAARNLDTERLSGAIVWASVLQSALVVMQYSGHDPLRWLGWQPDTSGSSRMRVYGTLGNPNFVAAWLCATLPLQLSGQRRTLSRVAASVLQVAAILATGSRVFLVALPAAALVLLLRRVRPAKWWLAAVPVALCVLWLSPARPLAETIRGRAYLARVTAIHLTEVPLTGWGAGSFAQQFGGWQVEWFQRHGSQDAAAPFAGIVDHPHNDYLELWVEYGPVGLFGFLALCGWLMAKAPRSGDAPSWAAAASLAAIACIDFPFHRPAEWGLFWLLLGTITKENQKCSSQASG